MITCGAAENNSIAKIIGCRIISLFSGGADDNS